MILSCSFGIILRTINLIMRINEIKKYEEKLKVRTIIISQLKERTLFSKHATLPEPGWTEQPGQYSKEPKLQKCKVCSL